MRENRRGLIYGFLCYCIWGMFPLYWKMIEHVDSIEILANRMVWSGVFMAVLFMGIRHVRLRSHIARPVQYLQLLGTGGMMTFNWGLYIWAINHGYILESSLGYYINPLLNVLLGFLFLHERLNRAQTIALLLAAAGVLYFTIDYGRFPIISIALATSFAFYGLFKKKMKLNATAALTVETLWMVPPAVIYITLLTVGGHSALTDYQPWHYGLLTAPHEFLTWPLLLLAGAVTAIPLLLYGKAAERISLSALGFLQYVSPTGQFLIGILVYHEVLTTAHLVCFGCIWAGLTVFTIDMVRGLKKR